MTNQLSLFCLVDGESTSNAFPISALATVTFGELKELIKIKKSVDFRDVDADTLSLWRVFIPVDPSTRHSSISLNSLDSKEELLPTDELSDVFTETPPKKMVHIIVQCALPDLERVVPELLITKSLFNTAHYGNQVRGATAMSQNRVEPFTRAKFSSQNSASQASRTGISFDDGQSDIRFVENVTSSSPTSENGIRTPRANASPQDRGELGAEISRAAPRNLGETPASPLSLVYSGIHAPEMQGQSTAAAPQGNGISSTSALVEPQYRSPQSALQSNDSSNIPEVIRTSQALQKKTVRQPQQR